MNKIGIVVGRYGDNNNMIVGMSRRAEMDL